MTATKTLPNGEAREKFYDVSVKAVEDDGPGVFEAIVSAFGNVDRYGERMVKGAFARTLKERGLPPIYFNHSWGIGPIGDPLDAKELDQGLWIKGQLYLDSGSDLVNRVYKQMLGPSKTEFSFAFRIMGSRWVTEDEDEVLEITEVDLYEVGPVTVGANPETELLRVASGLMLPAGAEKGGLQQLHDALVLGGARCDHDTAKKVKPETVINAGDNALTLKKNVGLLTKRSHEEA